MSDTDDRTPFDQNDERERDLAAAVGRLPRAIEPGRDLWPGIAARLGGPAAEGMGEDDGPPAIVHRSRGWNLALAAALLLTLAGAGLGLWRLALSGAEPPLRAAAPGAGAPAGVEATAASPDGEPTAVPAADAFGNRLLAALERKRYQLGPDASAAVEADIARLGLAIAELVAALTDHPDEATLYHQLAARQHQEAELLMRLNRL